MDFAVLTDQRVDPKDCEKIDKYPDLIREMKNERN